MLEGKAKSTNCEQAEKGHQEIRTTQEGCNRLAVNRMQGKQKACDEGCPMRGKKPV